MERKIKQEVLDRSHIKQEYNGSPNIKLEMSRSSNIGHGMSESDSLDDSSSSDSDGLPDIPSCDDGDSSDGGSRPVPDHKSQQQRMSLPMQADPMVLENVIETIEDFETIERAGPLTMRDIHQDKEYYIFRFPTGLMNPADLVKSKFRVGGKEAHRMEVNKKAFEVSTYENSMMADTPTLFVPDASGQLGQVDVKISGHIVIKQPPLNSLENQQFNIDDLRSRIHKPPEIQERNFFGSPGTQSEGEPFTPRRIKLSKEKRLLKEKKRLSVGEKNHAVKMETMTPGKPKSLASSIISSPSVTQEKLTPGKKKIKVEKMTPGKPTSLTSSKISSPSVTQEKLTPGKKKIKVEKKTPGKTKSLASSQISSPSVTQEKLTPGKKKIKSLDTSIISSPSFTQEKLTPGKKKIKSLDASKISSPSVTQENLTPGRKRKKSLDSSKLSSPSFTPNKKIKREKQVF